MKLAEKRLTDKAKSDESKWKKTLETLSKTVEVRTNALKTATDEVVKMKDERDKLSSIQKKAEEDLENARNELAGRNEDDIEAEETCGNLVSRAASLTQRDGVLEKVVKKELTKAVTDFSAKLRSVIAKTDEELQRVANAARGFADSHCGRRIMPTLELPPIEVADDDSPTPRKKTRKRPAGRSGKKG